MDKHEDIIAKALRHALSVCDNCAPKPEGVMEYIRQAIKKYNGLPQAAGPVWVKATRRRPKKCVRVIVRRIDDHDIFTRTEKGNESGQWKTEGWFYDDTEWLDESGQQVFTREQLRDAIENAIRNDVYYKAINEYMNTNYPIK